MEVLSEKEIEDIRHRFVQAALLTEAAGADGVDFKMCHGYFGSEILRPANLRNDRFGGSLENRTRFLVDSVREIKPQVSNSFLIGSRVSMYEGIRGGCGTATADSLTEDLTEMNQVVLTMAKEGMDYVDVSAGIPGTTSEITRPTPPSKWLYLHQFRYAEGTRKLLNDYNSSMPVIGSAYTILQQESPQIAEENLRKGYTDFVGFGRQSFADPLTPKKLLAGEADAINWCTGCSGCTKLMVRQVNDGCVLFDSYYRELIKSGIRGV